MKQFWKMEIILLQVNKIHGSNRNISVETRKNERDIQKKNVLFYVIQLCNEVEKNFDHK
jgi:hypothetical protein